MLIDEPCKVTCGNIKLSVEESNHLIKQIKVDSIGFIFYFSYQSVKNLLVKFLKGQLPRASTC